MRPARLLLLACLILAATLPAHSLGRAAAPTGSSPAKSTPRERPFSLRFADDSHIRVAIPQEKITVATTYGKLVVPLRDVTRIEFGQRMPEGADKDIRAAVELLGSKDFGQREAAGKRLLELGPYSYPGLVAAAKSADLEVSRRSKALVTKLEGSFLREQLDRKPHDLVHTAKFTIAGRIEDPTLEVDAAYFGVARLKLIDLWELKSNRTVPEQALAVDASRYARHMVTWMETKVEVMRGKTLKITASGQIDMYPLPGSQGQYVATPAGANWAGGGRMMMMGTSAFPPGALIGRIGSDGKEFLIGKSYEGVASADGKLYLRIEPSGWGNDSSGEYKLTVSQP